MLNGSSHQLATGNGTLGKLTIDNASGIEMPLGNSYTITDGLQLNNGIFEIGKNLLKLEVGADIIPGNPFSSSNMISTNISFTDNGVEKVLSAGGGQYFVFPIGAGGKYTPVAFTITSNGNSTGSITVKGANEPHPSIQNDAEAPDPEIVDMDNVLQYYWVLKANGITNFTGVAKMQYNEGDVKVTTPYSIANYITARLLSDGSGNWNKYNTDDVDELNHELDFSFNNTNDAGIEGDYTAGVDGADFKGAIPDKVPFYETNKSGDWTDGSIWTPTVAGGPRGAMVRINSGHSVTMPGNFISSYTTEITGTLKVNNTFGHRLGDVSGTGTLYTERESLPAGFYENFCNPGTGTFEFGGTSSYDILASFAHVNNVIVSGTGEKRFPNNDLTIYGNLAINGTNASLILNNDHDKTITIDGNLSKTQGVFDAGLGTNAKILFKGTSEQTITGDFTGSSRLYHVEVNNAAGLTLGGPVEIDGNLTFIHGLIRTTATNILSVNNTASIAVSGQSATRYVDGPMRKKILNGESFLFPVGDGNRFGEVSVIGTSSSAAQYWEAEYYNQNPTTTYDITSMVAPIQTVSGNEYWRIKGPAGGKSDVKIRWDALSQLPAATDPRSLLHIVEWNGTAWEDAGNTVTDNGINNGRIQTAAPVSLDEHVFTIGSKDNTPLPTAGFVSGDTAICSGGTADLKIVCSGTANWQVEVYKDGTTYQMLTITSSPFIYNVSDPGVYAVNAVSDINGTGNPFGNNVTVTVNTVPTIYTVTGGGAYCAGGSGVPLGVANSESGVSYTLLLDGNPAGITVPGTGTGAITFGNQTTAGTYTVIAADASDAAGVCAVPMTGSPAITVNPLPTAILKVDPALAKLCEGQSTQITIDFTGSGTYDFTISDGTNSTNITGVASSYVYSPTMSWINDGTATPSPETDYYFTITTLTDSNGCTNNTNFGNEKAVVFKLPETGPQYHISNDFGN